MAKRENWVGKEVVWGDEELSSSGPLEVVFYEGGYIQLQQDGDRVLMTKAMQRELLDLLKEILDEGEP